jgi:hypothetical protein
VGYIGSRACEDREAITVFGTDHETPAPPLRRTPSDMAHVREELNRSTTIPLLVAEMTARAFPSISRNVSQRRRAQANLRLGAIKRATLCCIATLGIDERPLLNWGH